MVFKGKFRLKRCNSKASYLTIQGTDSDKGYNLDHGSYKLTNPVQEEESIVPTFSTIKDLNYPSTNENIPCNLPDVLPAGVLQNACQTASYKILEQKGPEKMNANIEYRMHAEKLSYLTKEKDRHSISILDRDNHKILNDNQGFARSQSYDAGDERQTQSLDSKDTPTVSENQKSTNTPPRDHQFSKEELKQQSFKAFESFALSQPMTREYLRTHKDSNRSFDETWKDKSQLSKEEHITNCLIPALKRQSISRQQSLRENIEKITQLQSQLMSTHLSSMPILRPLSEELTPSLPDKIERPCEKSQNNEEVVCQQNDEIIETEKGEEKEKENLVEQKLDSDTLPLEPEMESLKLIQRSEVVLRVGQTTTVETACQTELLSDFPEIYSCSKENTLSVTSNNISDEQDIEDNLEALTNDLAELLTPENHIVSVLRRSEDKTAKDYVSNLYNPDFSNRSNKKHVGTLTLMRRKSRGSPDFAKESDAKDTKHLENSNALKIADSNPLNWKLEDLINHLSRKMKVLNSEQMSIQEQSASNEVFGDGLLNKMSDSLRPSETTRVRTYVDDVGHITSLLLSLSERLAKLDNNLNKIEDKNGEKVLLERKREMLREQLEEASRLKDDIDRRGVNIISLLEKILTTEELDDYTYFINMKAKLIVDTRDVVGKINLNEEQLSALKEALTSLEN